MQRVDAFFWRVVGVVCVVLGAGLISGGVVRAADARSGSQVVIGADEVIEDDLYLSGNVVVVDGTVQGDLMVLGAQVAINGVVEGDVFGVAQVMTLTGRVVDDMRLIGQSLMVGRGATVGDDVVGAGYSLELEANSATQGDVLFWGYQARLVGEVGGDVMGRMEAIALDGRIGGHVSLAVGDGDAESLPIPIAALIPSVPASVVVPGMTVGDGAHIQGDVAYTSERSARVSPQAQVGGTITQLPPDIPEEPTLDTSAPFDFLREFFALGLVGCLLWWGMPGRMEQLSVAVQTRPVTHFGWGIAALLLFGVGVVALLVISGVGAFFLRMLTLSNLAWLLLSMGVVADTVLVLAFWFLSNYMAPSTVGAVIGRRLLRWVRPHLAERRFVSLLVGLLVFVLLVAVPFLGGVVNVVVSLLTLGALCSLLPPGPASPKPRPTPSL